MTTTRPPKSSGLPPVPRWQIFLLIFLFGAGGWAYQTLYRAEHGHAPPPTVIRLIPPARTPLPTPVRTAPPVVVRP